tara:strand:+ start:2957 stop:4135 length:1179 start_codon:yes stop_codon:yes gene_type:complete
MIEESTTVPQEVIENQRSETKPSEPELTPEAQRISTVLNAVKENPNLVNDPEIAKIMEMANESPTTNGQEIPAPSKKPESPFVDKEQTPAENTDTQAVDESVFFGKQENKESEPIPSNLDEVYNRINKKYSINTEEGIDKFFNSVDKWRKQAQQSSQTERELNDIRKSFEAMPQPLFNAFESWTRGEDWNSQIAKEDTYIDYSKPFDNQNQNTMLMNYFGDEYTSEDLSDMDSSMKNKLVNLSKKQYKNEQKSYQDEITRLQNVRQTEQDKAATFVDKSVNTLVETFPEFNNDALTEIRQALLSNQVDALFKTRDGNYSEDAAKMLAFALYGDAENKRLMKIAKRRGESEATERLVTRGSDTPSVKGTQTNQPQGVKEVVKMFDGLFPKSTY